MYISFLAILLIFMFVPMISALWEKRKPKEKSAALTEKARIKDHLIGIAILWGSALVALAMCWIGGISPGDIGLRLFHFRYAFWLTVISLVLCGAACAYFIYQSVSLLVSAKKRDEAKAQMTKEQRENLGNVLPRTKKEKLTFSLLSLSAGICEEILYRGFLLFLLEAVFPGIPIFLLLLIPFVLFGLGHIYQGVQGVLSTGVLGLVLLCVYVLSGSLLPGMALHFLADVSSAFLLGEDEPV